MLQAEFNNGSCYESSSEDSEHIVSNNNVKTVKRKKYKQRFRDSWQSRYSWLKHENGKTYCTVCNTYLSGGGFHLIRHATTKTHVKKFNAAKKNSTSQQVPQQQQ